MRRAAFLLLLCLFVFTATAAYAQAGEAAPTVLVISARGPLTPAMAEYLKRGILLAEQQRAEVLLFELDTPGGSLDLMQSMVEAIRLSRTPVVVYIAPNGAMAGSAGTLITLAGHAAAMAPETAIGAASPVGGEGEELDPTLAAKLKNITKATARSFTERRGPEAVRLAEETIENAAAVSARQALDAGLVDFIAADRADLLRQLDGFTVVTAAGEITLRTAGAIEMPVRLTFIEQLLAILTNPNIVFLLLTVGVQAILIEISSPGGWGAGFIGAVCLALAAYGLGILPVNWFGLVFLGLAFVLFLLDIKAPTHGALTAAGVGSLIVGALVLFNSPGVPSFQRVSVPLIVVVSLLTGAMFLGVLLFAVRVKNKPVQMGAEALTGRVGVVRSEINPAGTVQLGGELWSAEAETRGLRIPRGVRVQVTRVEGVRLLVRPVEANLEARYEERARE